MMKKTILPPFEPVWGGTPIVGMESEKFYAAIIQDRDAIRLDVVKKDFTDGITWDELQEIKRDCGFGDKDAIEFYPKDIDVFNTGNVRHLFVIDNDMGLIRRGESNGAA